MLPIPQIVFFYVYLCPSFKNRETKQMKKVNRQVRACGTALALLLVLWACRPSYEVTGVEGSRIAMDSTWDARPDAEAQALLAPYKNKVDSVMQQVLGSSALTMEPRRPESLLSNLVADILREAATGVLGRKADMGLVNMGGLRATLAQGAITVENAYEVLPFENALCVLTVKGSVLRELFENIAYRLGEGVSGVRLEVSEDRKLLSATIGGRPVDDEKLYTVATVDYLAEGNDGMYALPKAEKKVCPPGATLRSLFIDYVKRQTASGKAVTSRVEGRVVVVKTGKNK